MGGRRIAFAAMVCAAAGCSFDPTGASSAAGPADAGVVDRTPDAAPLPGDPDARPADPPDAAPVSDPHGVVRAPRGTPDLTDNAFDDWGDAPLYSWSIDAADDLHPIDGYVPSASLSFRVMHDDDYLYFALIVEDDEVIDAVHPLWNDDSVSVFLDASGDVNGALGTDDHEIVIGSSGTYADYSPLGQATLTGDMFRFDGGYALELGVAKDSLGVATLPGTLGFNVAINDDDGGGSATYGLWYVDDGPRCETCCTGWSHAEAWCDTTTYGSLILE